MENIEIPIWLFVLLGLFALVGILDRVLRPSVRWYFQRKANRAIDELNTRLHLRIQPFKTTKRQTLIDQILFDPQVVEAVEAHAAERGVPRAVAMEDAERYAGEIVPAFNAYAYSRIGTRLARLGSNLVYRVRLGYSDDEGLSAIDQEATVVFVMNHRSNMDYVLVTYLASASATLSYAVGEWARVWLLQNLIRTMGAYFIRRGSGNQLYRRVLARYVHMATRSGVTQAMFPEGGLSRNGLLGEPKFGLLAYMISEFDVERDRDVVFVPVGINYDRVLEDRILIGAKDKSLSGATFKTGFRDIAGFLFNLLRLRVQGRLYRYGYACASFGTPVSLKSWLGTRGSGLGSTDVERFQTIEAFGRDLMARVGDVVPGLPVAIVATVFIEAGQHGISELELKSRALKVIKDLEGRGAYTHIPRDDEDYAVSAGLRMLTLRHIVGEQDGLFRANEAERPLLAYYANSIAHLRRSL